MANSLQNHGKELEKQACKTFVCPNLSLIDKKGRGLQLNGATIKRAKDLAIEYFKKTYRDHHYSSVNRGSVPRYVTSTDNNRISEM